MEHDNTFHLGLCMAGSVSAGAYTAGVIDYLHEALEKWEKERGKFDIPDHRVVIDLLGGTSGGGIVGALALFGLRDEVTHAHLSADRINYEVDPKKNIYWRTWVDLTENDVLDELLAQGDLSEGCIPSLLNSRFIDEVAEILTDHFEKLSTSNAETPPFLHKNAELFLSLFNVTGFKYKLNNRAEANRNQYVAEHRDLAHFRWSDTYHNDGRIPVSLSSKNNLELFKDAAKATGAFPVGLKARTLSRPAKYIWDNPFFLKDGKFDDQSISLGKAKNGSSITGRDDIYTSIHADGGIANNEPVELCRNIMLNMRQEGHRDGEKAVDKVTDMNNYSVILIDPFPSVDFDLTAPAKNAAHLLQYLPKLIGSMRSQLLFDAKEALEAYKKENYGLHLIAPSREDAAKPEHAIACASLEGFGGFVSREFRVHDFFLGRRNCQSFLRKYFVVNLNEKPENKDYKCVETIIDAYKKNEAAQKRFGFTDERGELMVPILPDLKLKEQIIVSVVEKDGIQKVEYKEDNKLPLYKLNPLKRNYFDIYRPEIKSRIRDIINFAYQGNLFINIAIMAGAGIFDDKLADKVVKYIIDDLKERGLMH